MPKGSERGAFGVVTDVAHPNVALKIAAACLLVATFFSCSPSSSECLLPGLA